ncbi:serine protease 52-like isoform X2 [Galleria mellonella]|uniref:Serine protease 52-like isoform X2 n=1 Tax=Galleria mellonella TaxID=7137 RepID=A0ABM3N4T1_GALME|nr:serine protease 52-like isoform X2 [Galleria mellonella]
MKYFILIHIIFITKHVNSKMEGFVMGGDFTKIHQYPHSIYLNIACKASFICGGSIINQDLILTAGHCLEECKGQVDEFLQVKYGHEHLHSMKSTSISNFIIHEKYDELSLHNDICLVTTMRPIAMGKFVKRIAIMRSPNLDKWAYTAGWGVMNLKKDVSTVLKHTAQKLQPANVCRLLGTIPPGTFCAGPIKGQGAPDQGDSGSALIISNYIQIGIVSYKIKRYSLVVYTNVSYHYNWIVRNAARLICRSRNRG